MHDVISAFLDNEPFDAKELAGALASAEGRDLLLDLVALRAVVRPADAASVTTPSRGRTWRWAISSAAAIVMIATGYAMGRQAVTTITAPAPTTVMTFEPGVNWNEATSSRRGGN